MFCFTSFAQMTNLAWRCIFNILEICPAVLAYCVVVGQNVVQSLASRAAQNQPQVRLLHNCTINLFPCPRRDEPQQRDWEQRPPHRGIASLTGRQFSLLTTETCYGTVAAGIIYPLRPRLATSPPHHLATSPPHYFPQFLTFIGM